MSPPQSRSGGLELSTLIIASISSVVAAVVVSHVWGGGTVMAAAVTPVIVALTKEALARPAERLSDVTVRRRGAPDELLVEEVAPGPEGPEPDGYAVYGARRRHWKIAAITGLAAFALAVAVLTLPELVAGRSVTSGGRDTTLFGGGSKRKKDKESTTSTGATETQTVTTQTTTVTVPSETTPQTAPPAQTTPTATTTTPAAPAPAAPPPTTTPSP
jgi:hypothetical protein